MKRPGQKFRPSASATNEQARVARDARAETLSQSAERINGQQLNRWVWARNSTSDDKQRGAPSYITGSVAGVSAVDLSVDQGGLWTASNVELGSAARLRLGIWLEPVAAGKVGRLAIDGAVFAKVKTLAGAVGAASGWVVPFLSSNTDHKQFLCAGLWGYAKILAPVADKGSLILLNDRQLLILYELQTAWSGGVATAKLYVNDGGGVISDVPIADSVGLVSEWQEVTERGWCTDMAADRFRVVSGACPSEYVT